MMILGLCDPIFEDPFLSEIWNFCTDCEMNVSV